MDDLMTLGLEVRLPPRFFLGSKPHSLGLVGALDLDS